MVSCYCSFLLLFTTVECWFYSISKASNMSYYLQFLVPSASPSFTNSLSILHQVPEGHVGAYWIGGALLTTITEPGRCEMLACFFYASMHKYLLYVLNYNISRLPCENAFLNSVWACSSDTSNRWGKFLRTVVLGIRVSDGSIVGFLNYGDKCRWRIYRAVLKEVLWSLLGRLRW